MEVEWVSRALADGNINIRHMEIGGGRVEMVGWLVGMTDFGNGVVLNTNNTSAQSRSFVAELSDISGVAKWAEMGTSEEFYDAMLETTVDRRTGLGQLVAPRMTILGGYYWATGGEEDEGEEVRRIIGPWDNIKAKEDFSAMVVMQSQLRNPIETSPLWEDFPKHGTKGVVSPVNRDPLDDGATSSITDHPSAATDKTAVPALPVKSSDPPEALTDGQDRKLVKANLPSIVSPDAIAAASKPAVLKHPAETDQTINGVTALSSTEDQAAPRSSEEPLSPLTISLLGVAAVVFAAVLFLGAYTGSVYWKRQKECREVYTSYRPTEECVPELRCSTFQECHSRQPSDGTATIALTSIQHLPPHAFSEEDDDEREMQEIAAVQIPQPSTSGGLDSLRQPVDTLTVEENDRQVSLPPSRTSLCICVWVARIVVLWN